MNNNMLINFTPFDFKTNQNPASISHRKDSKNSSFVDVLQRNMNTKKIPTNEYSSRNTYNNERANIIFIKKNIKFKDIQKSMTNNSSKTSTDMQGSSNKFTSEQDVLIDGKNLTEEKPEISSQVTDILDYLYVVIDSSIKSNHEFKQASPNENFSAYEHENSANIKTVIDNVIFQLSESENEILTNTALESLPDEIVGIIMNLKDSLNELDTIITEDNNYAKPFIEVLSKLQSYLDNELVKSKYFSKDSSTINSNIISQHYNNDIDIESKFHYKEALKSESVDQNTYQIKFTKKDFNEILAVNTDNSKVDNVIEDISIKQAVLVSEPVSMIDNYTNLNSASEKILPGSDNSILEQVVSEMKLSLDENIHEFKLKLKPEILGEVTIKIASEKGILTGKAFVENYHVKSIIESNLSQLKDNLKEQGLIFNSFDVSVGKDSSFKRQQQQSWSHSRVAKLKSLSSIDNNIDELNDSFTSTANINRLYTNGSIDVMA